MPALQEPLGSLYMFNTFIADPGKQFSGITLTFSNRNTDAKMFIIMVGSNCST